MLKEDFNQNSKSMIECGQQVIEAINRAFSGVTREGGVTLHEARVIDDQGPDSARELARAKDQEVSWDMIPTHDLENIGSVLVFLDDIGFRYYLPAYMINEIKQVIYNPDTIPPEERAVEVLGLYMDAEYGPKSTKLSSHQNQSIALFLKFFVQYGNDGEAAYAQKALNDYWHKFL